MPERRFIAVVFGCFFVSGFCSLLYEVVWTRLAFAHFGVITPVLSLVVSVFMAGLGVGSIYGAAWARFAQRRWSVAPAASYACAEAIVASGALAVPALLRLFATALLGTGGASSATFLALSAICIAVALFPWCVAMGATIPVGMLVVRQRLGARGDRSFSVLYAANVLGAASGAATTAFALVELFGLRGTLAFAACGNAAIAGAALLLAPTMRTSANQTERLGLTAAQAAPLWPRAVLVVTGFSSLGLEVCWAREFTFSLLTTIYAFAGILTTYLLATYAGSAWYRSRAARTGTIRLEGVVAWLFPAALLPLVLADPRALPSPLVVLASIVPMCAALGFLTPALIDRYGDGDGARAGRLYALNIAGGIAGPLVAGYLLLPLAGIRWSTIALALPLLAVALFVRSGRGARQILAFATGAGVAAVAIFISRAYDEGSIYPQPNAVRRDYAASAVAFGSGDDARLLVNAVPITVLTTDTKVMAHLPLAMIERPARVLDICFGMGTTFRSLSTWGVRVTAVDLSPSVIESFGFFHRDAAAVLADPLDVTVVDDGRRYLMRANDAYDLITIDPPPPTEASGSSLLYSTEFYALAKRRLAPGGILAQWVPHTEARTEESVALALRTSFPYVRAFTGRWGIHLLASSTPLRVPQPEEFVRRLPPAALRDLVEWEKGAPPIAVARDVLAGELPLEKILPAAGSRVPALSDDRPYNEYFLLRRSGLL